MQDIRFRIKNQQVDLWNPKWFNYIFDEDKGIIEFTQLRCGHVDCDDNKFRQDESDPNKKTLVFYEY